MRAGKLGLFETNLGERRWVDPHERLDRRFAPIEHARIEDRRHEVPIGRRAARNDARAGAAHISWIKRGSSTVTAPDNRNGSGRMKTLTGLCAMLLLAGLCWASPTLAQGIPRGSYLRSCTGVRVEGDALIAHCRRIDGLMQRSVLGGVYRCVGDIANIDGVLRCAYGGPPRPPVVAPGPPPDFVARCEALHREARDLREQIEHTWDPVERARLQGRLGEVRGQEARCR
jgi:hypothetical protein